MSMEPQVFAVISAAIAAYLADEEAYLAAAAQAAAPAGPPQNLWALAGRQGIMHFRQLLQRRGLR